MNCWLEDRLHAVARSEVHPLLDGRETKLGQATLPRLTSSHLRFATGKMPEWGDRHREQYTLASHMQDEPLRAVLLPLGEPAPSNSYYTTPLRAHTHTLSLFRALPYYTTMQRMVPTLYSPVVAVLPSSVRPAHMLRAWTWGALRLFP